MLGENKRIAELLIDNVADVNAENYTYEESNQIGSYTAEFGKRY